MRNIDVDRGVTIRKHNPTQSYVVMYKSEPGIYYNAQGHSVPESFAEKAGFDVKKMAAYRKRNEALTEFQSKAQSQLENDLEAINSGDFKVIAERNGFRLLQLPNAGKQARGKVVDADNQPMQGVPALPMQEAMNLFKELAGTEEKSKVEDKSKQEK